MGEWSAKISVIKQSDDELFHIQARTSATTVENAKRAAEWVLDWFARDHEINAHDHNGNHRERGG